MAMPPALSDTISDWWDMMNFTMPSPPPGDGNWSHWSHYDDEDWGYGSGNDTDWYDGVTAPQSGDFTQPHQASMPSAAPSDNAENPTITVEAVTTGSGSGVTVPGSVDSGGGNQDRVNDNGTLSGDSTAASPSSDRDHTRDDGTSHQLPRPGGDTGGGSFDPLGDLSRIQDAVDAVPDSITSENVDQFVDVLAYIPAADIASRLAPSAVSSHDNY